MFPGFEDINACTDEEKILENLEGSDDEDVLEEAVSAATQVHGPPRQPSPVKFLL